MFKRLTAALPYRLVTISQALSPLVVIGVLACLSVPNIALSGDDQGAPGGCPNTGTGDPAPCLADDGSQVSPPPQTPPPSDPAGGDQGAGDQGGGEPGGAGDQADSAGDAPAGGGPGPDGPPPVTQTPPDTAPAQTPAGPPADTADTTPTPDAKPEPQPKVEAPADKPQPPPRPRTRLGKPRVETQVAPQRRDSGRPAPPKRPEPDALNKLSSGGGASGTAPLPITSPMAPGPSSATVPNVLLDRFPIPPFLLPIYQAAGIEYSVPWQALAAINEIETDYGRNLSVSSAGAQGWMQFMPSSWRAYGVDANGDGRKDPYNPADAIFAAARYLKAAGAEKDLRQAIFSYNHAWWYVDSVMLRAKLVRALPNDLVSSLVALTQGRIPVGGPVRWRHSPDKHHRQLIVEAPPAAPVVAANDGEVVRRGYSPKLGAYLVLRDAFGNTYSYTHMGSVAREYAAVRPSALKAEAVKADATADPKPKAAASAGSQHLASAAAPTAPAAPGATSRPVVVKERLFAHPTRPRSYLAGGSRQALAAGPIPRGRVNDYFAGPVRLDIRDLELRPLRRGARVMAGTVLGHVGPSSGGRVLSSLDMKVRPAGAPPIDAQPFVNGWHLLAASGLYGGAAGGPLHSLSIRKLSIGQILLMSKEQLMQVVLNDPRIRIYECGRRDIATGQIDRRVLATLEYLAANGLDPLVTALKCGHSYYTTAGTVSEHSYGSAVDIASINRIAILGHQGAGSITETTIRKLLQLQGTMKPHQIISLMTFPGADNTLSMSDHANHIHVGFSPGATAGPGGVSALGPKQWTRLADRLGEIENPTLALPSAAPAAAG